MASVRVALISFGVVLAISACAEPEPGLELDDTTAAVVSPEGQGWDIQGWDIQGWDIQGWDIQGWDIQGWDIQGATFDGVQALDASVTGTELEVWRKIFVLGIQRAEQRLPDKTCVWTLDRATRISCTTVSPTSTPLKGVELPGSFRLTNGDVIQVKLRVNGVTSDSMPAMFRLYGHTSSRKCNAVDVNVDGCQHPDGCRKNCDVWLYNLSLVMPDKQSFALCPSGNPATAVAGTYAADGTYTPNSQRITFGCTNGTIAKCTRWGYRPWGSAMKHCNAAWCQDTTLHALAPYHQACIRAAMADYCANGTSFTRNGTLVDIYDYEYWGQTGFIPRAVTGTAFRHESTFDKHGANRIDYIRYAEIGTLDATCPGRFVASDDGGNLIPHIYNWTRPSPAPEEPMVSIDSTTGCLHSEHVVGRALHADCNACTRTNVESRCTDPVAGAWDASCVSQAQATCSTMLTTHGECTAGEALPKFATACTVRVCSTNPSCCSSAWSSACVAAANATCKGGQEQAGVGGRGFCGTFTQPPF